MVGEDFAIEDDAGHIDSTAVEKEEDITILTGQTLPSGQKSLRSEPRNDSQCSNSHAKASSVRHSRDRTCERRYDRRFDDEAGAATDDSCEHEWFAANAIHDACLETDIRTCQRLLVSILLSPGLNLPQESLPEFPL